MKRIAYLFFPFVLLLLSACDKDDDPRNDDRPTTLAWIEDTMREHYYWNDKIPAANKLSYTADPEDFFTSILYKAEDGKTRNGVHHYFSYIKKATDATRQGSIQEDYSYGFEFTSVLFTNNGSNYYGSLVLYVLPNTPAQKAGLKRGDWILKINNKNMTTTSEVASLAGDVAKTFTVYQYSSTNGFVDARTVNISAAEPVNYSPIYQHKVFSIGAKKVGYLVYDTFTAGVDDNDKSFDNKLRSLSTNEFNGVNEFILDLRYNNGGYLSCARLLCAILGPSKVLSEKQFGYLEYNNGSKGYFSVTGDLGNGKNMNLQRLFVLVSSSSASSSEAVISLLAPYMDVVVIGEVTLGKNVGSETYTSSDKEWEMQPITVKIFNSLNRSDYANGWIPDFAKGDVFERNNQGYVTLQEDIRELGDPNERLLSIALGVINGTYSSNSVRLGSTANAYQEGPNSLERRATNGVIID